ncbi:hypothetical protein PHYBLDRAFT_70327 [Phycomyces blakesleeanus NRRL 1555(-)]|uniref:Uncharacterized protein n=1 Tax=Phycomyces blakesleeanus (strain ATCC 8743b / DSM 1359 / FGSC 10004 / NBRC 33097 / NRRL 1555) TaxID=763407 RepID=A0A162TGK5_PHYB8|nr:hypothetical protein PHYBLDRAFT_70327 [Phycomyces blakesleeanus NRRL 1555(-)]OAD66973.1 hypothetical protein PHYBLDRAFT_70327 [Phycomyces blakesleeanus NRRL 1555(-)]|eukprot:XP_018285013.1 hypothetical protein PHYBLDRAFT_70327 [Phycomyces blakesleeanus NRRL 1555(-)]
MTKCIPTAPRRPNLCMNAVLNSTIAGVVTPIDTPTPEVAVDTAPEVQVAVTPIDHVLTLLAANNVSMQSLQENAKGVTDAISHLKNGLDLFNKTNEFLKNSVLQLMTENAKIKKVMTSQNSVMFSAVPADSSSFMDDDLDLGAKHHPLISQLINSYIKKPNFVSTDPLKLLDHRIITYQTYTEAIHEGMNQYDCGNILSIDVMSDGESDGDNKVRAYRPSWRTDELQTFISTIDKLTVIHLKKNSESLKKRIPYEKEVSIPKNLAVTLPDWCFSK